MVDNVFLNETLVFGLLALRYGGLVTIIIGFLRWATTKKSTNKNKQGIWLFYCGTFMFIIYLSWNLFSTITLWYIG